MVDREKVINQIEVDIQRAERTGEMIVYVGRKTAKDVLALLKDQEAVEPDTDSEGTCTCGNCGETVGYYPVGCKTPQQLCKFCPECGRSVKWDG